MMAAAVQASDHLRAVVQPVQPGESVKALVRRAAQRTGLPPSRAREIWYGRAKRIHAAELRAIEAAIPSDSVEFDLAYLRSLESKVATVLQELVDLRSRMEGASLDRP